MTIPKIESIIPGCIVSSQKLLYLHKTISHFLAPILLSLIISATLNHSTALTNKIYLYTDSDKKGVLSLLVSSIFIF